MTNKGTVELLTTNETPKQIGFLCKENIVISHVIELAILKHA